MKNYGTKIMFALVLGVIAATSGCKSSKFYQTELQRSVSLYQMGYMEWRVINRDTSFYVLKPIGEKPFGRKD